MPSKQKSDWSTWFYTLGLLVVWIIVLKSSNASTADGSATAAAAAAAGGPEAELKNVRNCKALCEHCGCLGFYCGEECICECNNENSDTGCIARMQRNARSLQIPFEILIQGPTANGFVRNALKFEQNAERKHLDTGRNKRSTVTIYKPPFPNLLKEHSFPTSKSAAKKPPPQNSLGSFRQTVAPNGKHEKQSERSKRSTGQLDWFSDLANDLVRPAPLGGRRRNSEEHRREESSRQDQSVAPKLDHSWFSENTDSLLTPAPLFKRQNGAETSSHTSPAPEAEYDMEPDDTADDTRLPQRLRKTFRNLRKSVFNDDFRDALGVSSKQMEDKLQNKLDYLREQTDERNEDFQESDPPPTPAPHVQQDYKIPWLRPARFLQRVQEAMQLT